MKLIALLLNVVLSVVVLAGNAQAQGTLWLRDDGFPEGNIISDILPIDDGTLIVTTHGGGIYLASSFGAAWQQKNAGLGSLRVTSIVLTPAGTLVAATEDKGIYRSTDGAETWTPVQTGISANIAEDLDMDADGRIYAAMNRGVYVSENDGLTWKTISKTTTLQIWEVMSGLFGQVYAATAQGQPIRTTDRGATWTALPSSVGAIYVFGRAPNGTLYAAGSDLSRSTDNGEHWQTIPLGNPLISGMTWSVTGVMYLAGGNGVERSTDAGSTWQPYTQGIESTPYVIVNGPDGHLLVGTSNGRLYRTMNSTSAVEAVTRGGTGTTLQLTPNPVRSQTMLTFAHAEHRRVSVAVYDALGRIVRHIADAEFEPGSHTLVIDATTLTAGAYICRLVDNGVVTTRTFVVEH